MKKNITVSLDFELWQFARNAGANISELCNEALSTFYVKNESSKENLDLIGAALSEQAKRSKFLTIENKTLEDEVADLMQKIGKEDRDKLGIAFSQAREFFTRNHLKRDTMRGKIAFYRKVYSILKEKPPAPPKENSY